MALGPVPSWWTPLNYSERLLDQHFGMGVLNTDLHQKMYYQGFVFRPRNHAHVESSGVSEVEINDQHFKATLDVCHFTRAEISIRVSGNIVEVRGKHEEKADGFGFIARDFVRKYMLPTGVKPLSVKSNLADSGLLTLIAPKETPETRPIDIDIKVEPASKS